VASEKVNRATIGDLVANFPEIDHVSAFPELWRPFDERRLKSSLEQSVSQCRASDTGSADEN